MIPNVNVSMHIYLATAVVSYLLGSIPFGYLLVRFFHGEDVRASGSGNIGATNVARKSPVLGAVTLVLDAAKGLAAVLLVRAWFPGGGQKIMTLAALFAILGHLFPVWLKFRGGKGVATSLGGFALVAPKSLLCMVGLFVIVVAVTRYISLGSIVAAAVFPLMAWAFEESAGAARFLLIALASALVIWRHRDNIGRLVAGTEPRLGAKRG